MATEPKRTIGSFAIIYKHIGKYNKTKPAYYTWVIQTTNGPKISVSSHKYATEASCKRSLNGWAKKLNFGIRIINYGSTYETEFRSPEMIEY